MEGVGPTWMTIWAMVSSRVTTPPHAEVENEGSQDHLRHGNLVQGAFEI